MTTREVSVGQGSIRFETGKLAKQAGGSVIVRSGDSVVLVTACRANSAREGIDFLPLTVDYREYTYASGRIPGGFFKREGKPSEKEVLTSRVIDRPIRPLFPSGWRFETQIIAMVLSADTENDTDVLAITGDHSTPALLRTHSWHPVPTLLWSRYSRPDGVAEFGERACARGSLGTFPATDELPLAMGHALRLTKYGA